MLIFQVKHSLWYNIGDLYNQAKEADHIAMEILTSFQDDRWPKTHLI